MTDTEKQIEELTRQLVALRGREQQLSADLYAVQMKLNLLAENLKVSTEPAIANEVVTSLPEQNMIAGSTIKNYREQLKQKSYANNLGRPRRFQMSGELENFIGTNLISKIGILVTIIGVFIGAKYAIDNELISPALRVLSGYIASAALVGIAFRLKSKYEYFSSVLMGGGLAVVYFMTYIGYSFYGFFPLWLAFLFMIVTTVAAVGVALWYNKKTIALIGQVAAYAIPFLLGDKSGNVLGLFAYISFINLGLLALSFKKDWKLLYHIAFFLTWLIYMVWYIEAEGFQKAFSTGLIFLSINFFTFYITFLSYKIYRKELYRLSEIGILLFNALFYFFLGTHIITETYTNDHFLTWFTLANATIHFCVGYCIYRLRLADETVFQFILGLGLLFITLAVPIELNGSWVTLLWIIEGTALFYIGVRNKRALYFDIALPIVTIAVISLLQDWTNSYPQLRPFSVAEISEAVPFLNLNFSFSLFVSACVGYIGYKSSFGLFQGIRTITAKYFEKLVPICFLAILYFTFFNEIVFAWDKIIDYTRLTPITSINNIRLLFRLISLIVYSCVYISIWLYINSARIKKQQFHHLLLAIGVIANAAFLFEGLIAVGSLREIYLTKAASVLPGSLIYIRYVVIAAVALLWLLAWKASKEFKQSPKFSRGFSTLFNITLLSVISNEFIHWMDLAGYHNQYKLGLSLICGSYALALIFNGIIRKKKHLRVLAMVLFGITLLKLFFYDIASLSTISKTIVLVLLGVLLLLASFLYNKYKALLFGKEES